MYIFVVLLSALFLGSYEVLKKVSLKKSSANEVLFFYCLSGFLVSLIFIRQALSVGALNIFFVFIKSLIVVLDWFLVLKAMEKLDVGIVTPFGLLSTILIVFGSALFFNEKLTWVHFASLLFISLGIVLLTLLNKKQEEKKKEKNYKYIIFLVIGGLLGGVSGLLDKYIFNVREASSEGVLVWFLFFNMLFYGIVYFVKNKKLEFKHLISNYWMILTGVAIVLAEITYYHSINMEGAQMSLISPIRKSSVVIATILASIFLKEKNLLKKLGILLIMLVGVVLPIIF